MEAAWCPLYLRSALETPRGGLALIDEGARGRLADGRHIRGRECTPLDLLALARSLVQEPRLSSTASTCGTRLGATLAA